jgi:exonuclease VII small subunit
MQKIPVFFRDEMVAPDSSFSPSASKPRLVVDAWRQAELTRNHVEMVAGFDPVSIDDLAKTHDRQHVMDVLMCEKPNGFGSIDRRLAASLLSRANARNALIEAAQAKVDRAQADLDAAITQVMVAERERATAQVALNKARARLDDLVAEQSQSSDK